LFWRIHNGSGQRRGDPAGTNVLAVDSDGTIYPSAAYREIKKHVLGNIKNGTFDTPAQKRFEDLGSATTPLCMQCWARNLCGGGNAAVNETLSGAWNTPHRAWCDAQRDYIARGVAAFNTLNQNGVNFNRIYGGMRPAKRQIGFLKMAWAAMRMQVGLRPLEEADAPLLKRWEDWCDASYFTLHERGVLTTTAYDREMDALHPRGLAQEFVLTRKNGEAMGLLRVEVSALPETMDVALFFADKNDWQNAAVRSSMKFILEEATKGQAVKHLVAVLGKNEAGARAFLAALGFSEAGVRREALYLHGRYGDAVVLKLSFQTSPN